MAAGGTNRFYINYQNEEYFDDSCSICEGSDKIIKATYYCCTCDKYFCDACKTLHQQFTGQNNHKLLEESARDQWGIAQTGLALDGEECTSHKGNVVTIFCGQHDELCCTKCDFMNHSTCENKAFLPDITLEVLKGKENLKLLDDLKHIKKDIRDIREKKIAMRSCLQDFKTDYKTSLNQLKSRINKAIKVLEIETDKKMTSLFDERNAHIQSAIDKCDEYTKEFDDLESQLNIETSKKANAQAFAVMKRGSKKVLECREEMHWIANTCTSKLQFLSSNKLFDYLEDVEDAFGEFQDVPMSSQECISIENYREICVRAQTDKRTCDIQGMCQLLNGNIVLSDHRNKNLKLLDHTYTVIDTCDMPGKPKRVCRTGLREVAVALGSTKTVQFVSVTDRMRLTVSVRLTHNCDGIAYHRNKLYVIGNWIEPYVYTYIMSDQRNNSECVLIQRVELKSPTSQIVNCSGTRIIVVGKSDNINVLDLQGNLIFTAKHKKLTHFAIKDVCVDSKGNVFVSTNDGNIVQFQDIDNDPIFHVFPTNADGPETLMIDTFKSKLLLQRNKITGGSDVICTYDIIYEH